VTALNLALASVGFALASAGLIDAGRTWLGVALGIAFLVNRLVLFALREQ
jgi:hypothetical protein